MSVRTRAALRTQRQLAVGDGISTAKLEALGATVSEVAESMTAFARAFGCLAAEWSQTMSSYVRWFYDREDYAPDETTGVTIDQLIDDIDRVLEEMT